MHCRGSNDFYAWYAEHYPHVYGWRPDSLVERWRQLGRVLREHGCTSILDAACGVGRDALELARLGFEVFGIDLSPDMIAVAEEKAREDRLFAQFKVGDLSEIGTQLGEDRFDAVMCLGNSLLHAADRQQAMKWVAELAGGLRPGGLLFLQVETVDHLQRKDASAKWLPLKVQSDGETMEIFLRRTWHNWDAQRIEKTFLHLRLSADGGDVDEHPTSLLMLRRSDIGGALAGVDMRTISRYASPLMDPYIEGQSDGVFVIAQKPR
jgi:SAM-dependent methyltransferase